MHMYMIATQLLIADLNKGYIKPETVVRLSLLNDTVLISVFMCLFLRPNKPFHLSKHITYFDVLLFALSRSTHYV